MQLRHSRQLRCEGTQL